MSAVISCSGVVLLRRSAAVISRSRDAEIAANKAKSAFLANMSHDIRTPLNGILGFARLLSLKAKLLEDPEAQSYLKTIYSSGQHLLFLINDILDLSKVEAGRLDCHLEDVVLLPLFEEVMLVLNVRAVEKSISLDSHWLGLAPPSIRSDRARLKQILINLVGNAIKFTINGAVSVVARVQPCGGRWVLETTITDSGIGIPSQQLAAIFEPFRQAEGPLSRGLEGTGLGLSISRHLARLLGGDVEVTSVEGQGSTFTVTVDAGQLDPSKMQPITEICTAARKPQASAPEACSVAGRRILVVDDGKVNRDLIRIVLQRAGAEVSQAEHGEQGVAAAMASAFDAILMDMQMPVLDGLSAVRRLRQAGSAVPIIALTANAMESDRIACFEAGCSGFLTKPVDHDALVAEVARLLDIPVVNEAVAPPAVVGAV